MQDLRLSFSDEHTDKYLQISFILNSDDKHGLASYFLPRHLFISMITIETNLSAALGVNIVNLRISNWCPVNYNRSMCAEHIFSDLKSYVGFGFFSSFLSSLSPVFYSFEWNLKKEDDVI